MQPLLFSVRPLYTTTTTSYSIKSDLLCTTSRYQDQTRATTNTAIDCIKDRECIFREIDRQTEKYSLYHQWIHLCCSFCSFHLSALPEFRSLSLAGSPLSQEMMLFVKMYSPLPFVSQLALSRLDPTRPDRPGPTRRTLATPTARPHSSCRRHPIRAARRLPGDRACHLTCTLCAGFDLEHSLCHWSSV